MMSIIKTIVYAGLLLTAVNIYLNFKLKLNTPFAKVIQLFNIYLAIHFVFLGLVETVWLAEKYLDQMAPFSLLYGSFLYFTNYLTRSEKISLKKVLPHLLLPIIFWVWFLVLLLSGVNYTDAFFVRIRMFTAIVGLLAYILGTIFFNKKPLLKKYHFIRPIIIFGSISLLIMVIIAIKVASTKHITNNEAGITSIRTVVYLCMLACAIMVFRVQLSLSSFIAFSSSKEKNSPRA